MELCVFKEYNQSSSSVQVCFLLFFLHTQGFTFIREKEIARALSDLSPVCVYPWACIPSSKSPGLSGLIWRPTITMSTSGFPFQFPGWSVRLLLAQVVLWPWASRNISLLKLFAITPRFSYYHFWQYLRLCVLHSKANLPSLAERFPLLTACPALVKLLNSRDGVKNSRRPGIKCHRLPMWLLMLT